MALFGPIGADVRHPTSAVIPAGVRVEREVSFVLSDMQEMRIALRNPDFTTALRIERAINDKFGKNIATMLGFGTVRLDIKQSGASNKYVRKH
jgi:flagellar P-ring protein precursor FlgI